MPQMAFVQGMAVAGLLGIVLVVLAIPVGARVSARAGSLVLRLSLVGVLVSFVALAAWGASSGDLAAFNARMGTSSWLQMGAFFGIIYFTGYRFVASYLADKGRAHPTDRPDQTPAGGTDA